MESKQAVHLHSHAKDIAFNVTEYVISEKQYGGIFDDVSKALDRAASATKLSKATLSRIRKKAKENEEHGSPGFVSPQKRQRRRPVTDFFDEFNEQVLRRTVLEFYERHQIHTLEKIHEEIKNKLSFNGSRETLRKVLKKMGFRYADVDGRRYLMERNDVTSLRFEFLQKMKEYTNSDQTIVYTDETWINQNYTVPKCWMDTTSKKATGVRVPSGKGARWIILHAGTKNGFVPECTLTFQAKNVGDYHDQMNADTFEKWFKTQLLPNIPPSSVIVMDNAPYHSRKVDKPPIASNNKAIIRQWLEKKGVPVPEGLQKVQLMNLVAEHTTAADTSYVVDRMALQHGHTVVRLPPYHCQYNAIELIWAQVKGYVAKRNTFKKADIEPLIHEALSTVTPENWKDAIRHAEKLQEDDARRDVVIDHFVDSFIVTLTPSDAEDAAS